MKFLVDEALSWRLARELSEAGHDAVHVDRLGLVARSDEAVYEQARREDRVVITRDGDYAGLWRLSPDGKPSVLLLRVAEASYRVLAGIILAHLSELEPTLLAGAHVTIGPAGIRLHDLS